ncbi:hypothetical protein ACLB0R_16075 [Sphingomonas sp. GlSt437]|uniref:hypothetical protein n=1 Tax=Sphingomonas sp. GlSt437 TaxID=3389970 RepID=UPI003A88F939
MVASAPAAPAPSYADIADLIVKSPVIADVTIHAVQKVKPRDAVGVKPGKQRLLVTATLNNLLRGTQALPKEIQYLIDVPSDAKGHIPKLKKQRVLAFGRPVSGQSDQIQLTGDNSQQPWNPALDTTTRHITAEVVDPAAPPEVTGIGNAFHVPGALPGEGETQLFLSTTDGRPVSISVLSRPGQPKSWSVALSEIVDESAKAPARDTLLWYRLACFLPRALPAAALASNDEGNAAAAREDYRFVLQSLGACGRTIAAP